MGISRKIFAGTTLSSRAMALAGVAAIAIAAALPGAAKANVVLYAPVTAPLTITNSPAISGMTALAFSGASVDFAIATSGSSTATYFPNQNVSTIQTGILSLLSNQSQPVPFALYPVTQLNSLPSGQVTIASSTGFNYVAIHQDQGEIVLKLASYVTSFSFTGLNGTAAIQMSNYRTFTDGDVPPPIPGVPEPATLALLGAGLLGLIGARRRSRSR